MVVQRIAAMFSRVMMGTCLVAVFPSYALDFSTFNFPPFSQQDQSGEVSGPFVGIIKDICKEMNEPCTFEMVPNRRLKMKVANGEVTGGFPYGWNAERAKTLYFSVPFMLTEYGVFVSNKNQTQISGLSDMQGFHVGVFGPSNTSKSLDKLQAKMEQDGLKPITIKLQTDPKGQLVKMVNHGRIDAIYNNKAVTMYRAKELNEDIRYAWKDKELLYFVAFPKEKTDINLVKRFNQAALKLFSQSGYLDGLLTPWSILPPPLTDDVLDKYDIAR
ncbi:hypothetical protein GCM10007938_36040 [Vibrio zhanjiangensis]|uniref:Solute-binding protein family 3/N-terminal domain-containing protein n=1 Tax=Vibrio zhanjiangensis TaxID=1046128 RepID=A0ABQ6F3M9_9VIBR|nr:transporter substrate-binding domain-containing protein [Vibrio zhanjiangensis]GLT19821.1 hypothetical protein GCM10007938_36040 [Vibrio zhanjiangensis]